MDAYIKFKSGETKYKAYMKDYKALHHIDGLSDNAILVYEAIRNLVGMYVLQQKYKESYKKQKSGSIGTTRTINNKSVIGTTMVITNPMLQEWIGDKSHNTIKSALEQLESMGFIKCTIDGVKKTGRKITLLRDMEEYQPEEIEALEAYLNGLGKTESIGNEKVLTEDKNSIEVKFEPVEYGVEHGMKCSIDDGVDDRGDGDGLEDELEDFDNELDSELEEDDGLDDFDF